MKKRVHARTILSKKFTRASPKFLTTPGDLLAFIEKTLKVDSGDAEVHLSGDTPCSDKPFDIELVIETYVGMSQLECQQSAQGIYDFILAAEGYEADEVNLGVWLKTPIGDYYFHRGSPRIPVS
ncbi:MAG: hypothetical protein V4480_04190 [Patescibacteria group bacterium]